MLKKFRSEFDQLETKIHQITYLFELRGSNHAISQVTSLQTMKTITNRQIIHQNTYICLHRWKFSQLPKKKTLKRQN